MSKLARCRPSWKKRTSRKARKRKEQVFRLKIFAMLNSKVKLPSCLLAGAALQMEDLDWSKMKCTTYDITTIKLKKGVTFGPHSQVYGSGTSNE
jgi:hypothetical protein